MLTREQVSNLLIVGDVPYGNAHRLALAHDAEQRQTFELEQQKVAAACEVIAHYKQTIDAQAQRIKELEAALERHQEDP